MSFLIFAPEAHPSTYHQFAQLYLPSFLATTREDDINDILSEKQEAFFVENKDNKNNEGNPLEEDGLPTEKEQLELMLRILSQDEVALLPEGEQVDEKRHPGSGRAGGP